MALSSIDIRRQEFSKRMLAFGAYPPREIHEYLETLAKEVDIYNEKLRGAYEQIQRLKGDLEHYQKVEEALQEALETARENARKTQQNAEQKAALIIRDAESRGARTIEEASLQAQKIVHEAEVLKAKARQEVAQLNERRNELTIRLKGFLQAETELIGRIEKDYFNFLTSNDGLLNVPPPPPIGPPQPDESQSLLNADLPEYVLNTSVDHPIPSLPIDLPASPPDSAPEIKALVFEEADSSQMDHEGHVPPAPNDSQEEILAALENRQKAIDEELRKLLEPMPEPEEEPTFDFDALLSPTQAPPPLPNYLEEPHKLAPIFRLEPTEEVANLTPQEHVPSIMPTETSELPSSTEDIPPITEVITLSSGEKQVVAEVWEANSDPEKNGSSPEPMLVNTQERILEALETRAQPEVRTKASVSDLVSFSRNTPVQQDPIPVVRVEYRADPHPLAPAMPKIQPQPEVESAPLPPITANLHPEFIQMHPAGIPRELLTASLTEAEKIQRILDELQ